MSLQIQAYFYALGSCLAFSAASLLFVDLARKVSPLWMNVVKASVAWLCFALVLLIGGSWISLPGKVWLALLASGIVGLAVGDIFLLTAYVRMGAARTLILFGFQPLFIAVEAHFLFHQEVSGSCALAVLFFIACLFTFSLERFRQEGHWELYGLGAALLGVLLDNAGVLFSRWSFDHGPDLGAFQANFIRCSGALAFFFLFGSVKSVDLVAGWRSLSGKSRVHTLIAAFLGTFLALFFYLSAVKIGNLASISALGAAGPILASAMECIYLRKAPSRFLIVALILFLAGFFILTTG